MIVCLQKPLCINIHNCLSQTTKSDSLSILTLPPWVSRQFLACCHQRWGSHFFKSTRSVMGTHMGDRGQRPLAPVGVGTGCKQRRDANYDGGQQVRRGGVCPGGEGGAPRQERREGAFVQVGEHVRKPGAGVHLRAGGRPSGSGAQGLVLRGFPSCCGTDFGRRGA